MNSILVTGGAGFIGSHFVDLLLKEKTKNIVVFDKLTYAGKISNMATFIDNDNVIFIKGDISSMDDLRELFDRFTFSTIYNFAAESHVDNSISSPSVFVEANVIGTHNLLNMAKHYWQSYSNWRNNYKFVQISTDEVYGMLGDYGLFTENTCLNPSSPYSASKASADLICLSYFKTYGFPIVITRSSNNFGPRQDMEKLIPKTIINSINKKNIPIYGNGLNVRDWIFVEDNCLAIYLLSKLGVIGNIYNVGGNNEMTNLKIVNKILEFTLNLNSNLIEFVADRSGHDFRYAIDDLKTKSIIGNYKKTHFELALKLTIDYYKVYNAG